MLHGNCQNCGHMLALVGENPFKCLVNKCDCEDHGVTIPPSQLDTPVGRAIGGRCNKCEHPYHLGRCPVWRLDKPKRCACVNDTHQGET